MVGSIDERADELVESLVSPFGPLARVYRLPTARGLSRVATYSSIAGRVEQSYGLSVPHRAKKPIVAGGRAIDDPGRARLVAVAEGAERYAAAHFASDPLLLSRASDLDGPTIDLSRIPRCSDTELARSGCPLRTFEADAPMRWIRGLDLHTGAATWVPAIMACYRLRDITESERFWYPISTGYAVHSDPAEALVRAIFEIIERDIIAVLWLQMLPLPLISLADLSPESGYLMAMAERHFAQNYLFDATTDIGVPAVYCLRVAAYDPCASHVVGCAVDRDIASAAQRALLEANVISSLYYADAVIPSKFEDFYNIEDGARYMAARERSDAFDFLKTGASERVPAQHCELPDESDQTLAFLIRRLSDKGMQAIVVDRTPPELATKGLTAVCVIIPDLQPLTMHPFAQYRAHPRLYSAPDLMGFPVRTEKELNSWPQPFA